MAFPLDTWVFRIADSSWVIRTGWHKAQVYASREGGWRVRVDVMEAKEDPQATSASFGAPRAVNSAEEGRALASRLIESDWP